MTIGNNIYRLPCIDAVEKMIKYLLDLPEGSELSTRDAVQAIFQNGSECSEETLFDLHFEMWKRAPKAGLKLDYSPCEGPLMGLPYNFLFVVRKKNR